MPKATEREHLAGLGGRTVHATATATTMTIDFGGQDTQTVTRTTSKPVRSFKGQQHRKAAHVSQGTWKACAGTDSSSIWWD